MGPTQAEVDAAQAMSEDDRAAMIKGMVERLAQKLEANPRNLDGWVQLMRARIVMGDIGGAKSDLNRSLDAFSDSPRDRERLRSAAIELGLAP